MKQSGASSRGSTLRVLAPAFLLVLLAFLAAPAAANPPSDMSLSYDPAASVLSVTITHPVAGISGHYIGDVKIAVNGNPAGETKYMGQPSDTFTYTYPLLLKPGDTVDVTATCSLAGSATRSYSVPAAAGTAPPAAQQPAGTAAPAAGQPVQPASPTPKVSLAVLTAAGSLGLLILLRKLS